MKKWETPDMMTLNVNQTAMGGEEFTVIDRRYRDSNNKTHADFGEFTSSGKPVPKDGVTWLE
ncbi:MAG: hypothetical protein K5776_07200 [Lachnospiraceae bacterium]|nr:hypothetical protein [Lachnospiraceae bacterium]